MSAAAILLADGMRFLSMRARVSSQIFWSSASTFATYSFAYDACCSLSCFLFFVCNLFLSVSNLSCRLGFLLSFGNLLDLNLPPSHVFRSSASFAAIDLASSAICFCLLPLLLFLCHALPYIFSVLLLLKRFLDSLQLLSASQLQSSFQS